MLKPYNGTGVILFDHMVILPYYYLRETTNRLLVAMQTPNLLTAITSRVATLISASSKGHVTIE